MKLNKKIIPIILIAIAPVIVGLVWFGWLNNNGNRRIIISGNIELTEVSIAFKTSGKLIELAVKEGDLVKKGMALARLDSDQLLHQQDRANAALSSAESKFAQLQTSIRFDRENIQGQIEQRKAELRQAEALRIELQRKEQEIKTYQSEIDRSRADIALIESQLSDTIGVCPIDGIVLSKAAEAGEVLSAGTTVVTIGDISHPWLRGYIGEQDLGRVKLGMKVRVKTDSFPDKVYGGKLSFISPEAEFTPKQIQTPEERVKLVYRIKIDIENPNQELKLNMPADAEIIVGE
jgi:HlyD family secretion protein